MASRLLFLVLRAALAASSWLAAPAAGLAFDCVEKYCPQMESCAEAYYHLTVCGEAKRDADNDGIPCENVCGKTEDEFHRRLGTASPKGAAPLQLAPLAKPGPLGASSPDASLSPPQTPPAFSCAGKRKCGEMASCEEARFYLSTCGVRSLDRDHDGVPCESLCGGR